MKNEKEIRQIPSKNYVVVLVVSVIVIVLTLYVRSFYLNYQAVNTDTSVFYDKSINQINIEDIDYAVNETTDGVLFVSYNGDKSISSMERRLYREIERKNLNDKILYLNVTEHMNDYLDTLRGTFNESSVDINKAPMFIYIKDGKCVEVVDSSHGLVDYKVLNTLLNKYEIE